MDDILMPGNLACATGIFFLFGIISTSEQWDFLVIAVSIASVGVGAAVYKLNLYKISIACFLAFCIGALYYTAYGNFIKTDTRFPIGKSVSITGVISTEPTPSSNGTILSLNARPPFKGEISVFTAAPEIFHYGDLIKVNGTIDPSDGPWDNPFLFSRTATVLGENYGNPLRAALIGVKAAILEKFNEVLPPEQAALLGGIAFGAKQDFTPELKRDMALAGLTHMVAISGYNITIIIISAEWISKEICSRRGTLILTVLFIIFFILMSGISASSIRAAIMGSVGLLSAEIGRSYDIRNSMVFTAAAMALQNPTIIMHDAGFQLSFLSLTGIVCFEAPLKNLFNYNDAGFMQWKAGALTTLSAQLGVMPVLIARFGIFSVTSIGANILVLGTIPLTMLFGFILAPLGFLSKGLAFFAARIAGLFLGYQLSVIKLFARLAIPLPVAFNSILSILLYYGFLIIFAIVYGKNKRS